MKDTLEEVAAQRDHYKAVADSQEELLRKYRAAFDNTIMGALPVALMMLDLVAAVVGIGAIACEVARMTGSRAPFIVMLCVAAFLWLGSFAAKRHYNGGSKL